MEKVKKFWGKYGTRALPLAVAGVLMLADYTFRVGGGIANAAAAPDFTYFASKSDWSQADLTNDSTSIKINLGTVPSSISGASYGPTDSSVGLTAGNPITWWVVGSDGSSAANLYSEKTLCRTKFHDSSNKYSSSYIRSSVLSSLHTQLFAAGTERNLIADSTVKTYNDTTVTDKMYLPSGGDENGYAGYGSGKTTIYVPQSGGGLNGHASIPIGKWASNYTYNWLRSPGSTSITTALVSYAGSYVINVPVGFNDYGVAPACKINLSSLIFSSAARSAATTASVASGENLASYKGTHRLRVTDSTNTGSSIKRKAYTEVVVEGAPTSGTYYLMVQGVSGSTNYAYAKKVSSGTATIKTSDITSVSVTSFEGAKAWVEKESTANDGQLLYANALTSINSSTPRVDPTINSTSTSVTYAPSLKLSSVSLPSTSGNTAGSWAWVDGTQSVGDAGTHYFDATFTPSDTNSYAVVTKSITVTVNKATLSASNFSYTAPADLINNGNPKTATVTANSDITGIGSITVNYYNSSGTKLSSAPTDVGTYTVKIDVAEGTNYNSATGLSNNWGFTIMTMDIGPLYGESNADIKYGQVATVQNLDIDINASSVTYGWYKGSSTDPDSTDWTQLNSELSYRCKKEDVGSYLMFRVMASNGDVYSKVCSKVIGATTVNIRNKNDIATVKSQIGNGNNGIMINNSTLGITEIEVNDVQDLLLASVIVDCGKSDLNIKFNCESLDMTNQNYIPLGSNKNPYKGHITGNGCTINNYQHGIFTGNIAEGIKSKLEISNVYDDYAGLVGNMENGSITGLKMNNTKLWHKNYVGTFLGFGLNCRIEDCSASGLEITAKGECIGGIAAAMSGSRDTLSSEIVNCNVSGCMFTTFTAKKIIGGIVGDGYNININSCSCDDKNLAILANNYNCKESS